MPRTGPDRKPAAAPAAGDDGDQLKADVKAFAAQLGLSSGGGFSDGAFDDFAPQKASQRIGGDAKKLKAERKQQDGQGGGRRQDAAAPPTRQQQQQQGGRDGAQQQQQRGNPRQREAAARQQQGGGRGPRDDRQQAQRRPWQPGSDPSSEPQPQQGAKIPNAKSMLPRDEPTIWHEAASSLPPLPATKREAAPEVVRVKRQLAERLLLVEEQAFEQDMSRRSAADAKWLQQVRRSGTTSDRVAALSVLVQDGAAANLAALDGLLVMCAKKGGARAVVGAAMDALRELFVAVLLPDRKLRFFEQQPLDKVEGGKEGDRRLLYWLVEDGVKKRYAQFVEALDAASRDSLEFIKDRAVKSLSELLAAKPEQEGRLLAALVNKLGDPDRKLASKVGYLLTRLLTEHPGMNVPVVREIERFMFRPGLQERARYYSVVYLNQMVLSHRQPSTPVQGGSLPKRLIDVYFTLFTMIQDGKIGTAAQAGRAAAAPILAKQQADKAASEAAKRKRGEAAKARAAEAARAAAAAAPRADHGGEMDGRMLSALITGVRRAFPYVPAEEVEPLIEAHADSLFRLVHARSFGVATQALLLLFQLMSSRSTGSDRFYRALYAVLCSPELLRSTKGPMFLSLLFKALQADTSARRSAAFAKRLLQVAQESPPHFACGCLLLTSELLKVRPALWGAVLQAEEGEGDGLERFTDAPDGQAPQGGGSEQAAMNGSAEGLRGSEEDELAAGSSDDEAEEEEAGEVEGDSDGGSDLDLMPGAQRQQVAPLAPHQQQHLQRQAAAQAAAAAARWPASKEAYDMAKREPLYCNADRSCLWELTSLATHVHPSVAAMARTLLAGQSVMYSGDPLRDLTLAAFLEKFVQKKAKAAAKGDSAMQPLAAQAAAAAAAKAPHQWAMLAGAHTQALAALAEKDVRPDDMFFHKYYSLQAVQAKAAGKKKKPKAGDDDLLSDAESDDSDAADDFLAGEEEGGDEGIGADPDRSGMDYDYADLAAAMDSDDDSLADPEGGGSSGEEGGSGGEGEGSGSEEEGSGDEPAGATFSDMSDSGDDDEEGGAAAAAAGSDSGGESGGLESGSEVEGGSSDGEFEAQLAAEDLLSDGEEDGDASSGSEGDDAAADAEVAELLRRHAIQPLSASEEDEEEAALNPFELAEASSSEEEGPGQRGGRRGSKRGAGGEPAAARGKRGKRDAAAPIFASAEDYAAMIEQDLAGAAGLDSGGAEGEQEQRRSGGRRGGGRSGRGRGGRGASPGRGGRQAERGGKPGWR